MSRQTSCKKAIISQISKTLDGSTIHGFPNIIRKKDTSIKLLWFTLSLVSALLCGYLITKAVMGYFSYEVVTNIKIERASSLEFPTVEICKWPFTTEYSKKFIYQTLKDYGLLSNSNNSLFASNSDNYQDQSSILKDQSISHYYSLIVAKYLNDSMKKQIGLKLDDVLISCIHGLNPCDKIRDFSYSYERGNGNCYKYNSGQDINGLSVNKKKSTITGKLNGFSIELFIGSLENNQDSFSTTNGLNIYITNNDDIANTEGISISPGFSTNIIIDKVTRTEEPIPYSNCVADLTLKDSHSSHLYKRIISKGLKYKHSTCIDLCYQKYVEESECNCSEPMNEIGFYDNKQKCSTVNQLNCNQEKWTFFIENNFASKCNCIFINFY